MSSVTRGSPHDDGPKGGHSRRQDHGADRIAHHSQDRQHTVSCLTHGNVTRSEPSSGNHLMVAVANLLALPDPAMLLQRCSMKGGDRAAKARPCAARERPDHDPRRSPDIQRATRWIARWRDTVRMRGGDVLARPAPAQFRGGRMCAVVQERVTLRRGCVAHFSDPERTARDCRRAGSGARTVGDDPQSTDRAFELDRTSVLDDSAFRATRVSSRRSRY